MTTVLQDFADLVGPDGPVTCVGGRTHWALGGAVRPDAREVSAPDGVVTHQPAEMITRVRAGTTLADLQRRLAEGGQFVTLEATEPETATVGGVIAAGWGGVRRLGWGPPRDTVLEVTAVNARGELIRSGAPLVKNVTGFDLCRLITGSLGTLAFVAEVVLRCRPRPQAERWWRGRVPDPAGLARSLYRPMSVLWDGTDTWVGLEGYQVDIDHHAAGVLGSGFEEVAGPPDLPGGHRTSLAPSKLSRLGRTGTVGPWLAEVGVGVVHSTGALPDEFASDGPDPVICRLHSTIKTNFDPAGRLNPGRSPLAGGGGA